MRAPLDALHCGIEDHAAEEFGLTMSQDKTGEFRVGLVQMCTGRTWRRTCRRRQRADPRGGAAGCPVRADPRDHHPDGDGARRACSRAVRPEEGNAAIAHFSALGPRARHLAAPGLHGHPARQRQDRQPLVAVLARRATSRRASTRSICSTCELPGGEIYRESEKLPGRATPPCWPSCPGARWA